MGKVLLLTIGMFALGFDAYVVAGLLPQIGTTFEISDSQTGQSVSVFTLCYALAAPVFVTLLAGKSARKVLIVALVIFSVANGASAIAPNFSLFLLTRAIAGIGAGLFSPLAVASATMLVPEQKRGRALSMTLGGMSMGTVIGVPLGLKIAESIGWQGTIWFITLIGLIAMVGLIMKFPDIPTKATPSLSERFAILTNKQVSATVGITFIASVASLGLYTYLSPVLENLDNINNTIPYLWAWGIGGVIGSFSIGMIIDRIGRIEWIVVWILTILAIAMFSIPLVIDMSVPGFGFIPFVLWGAAGWAALAPQQHILIQSQPQHGATAVALNSSANYLGGSVGTILGGGILFTGLTPSYLPFVAGCIVSIALLGQVMKLRKSKLK
ncbi:MFS transporter [Bacillus sp. JJ722]|uniref:MFS transporter n=1 Tax=Bacillus sp. JJ722 TaxID=3122973 RepID=UPI002FFD990F